MIFWKPFKDIVSNIKLFSTNQGEMRAIATGYDRSIIIVNTSGEILAYKKLNILPEIYSLGFFFKNTERSFENITCILLGSAIKRSTITILDNELHKIDEIVLDISGNDRITFLKTFYVGNINYLLAGSNKSFFVGFGKQEIEVRYNIPLRDIPIDAYFLSMEKSFLIGVISSMKNLVRIFELDPNENTFRLISEFRAPAKPVQILLQANRVIVSLRQGILLSDINGKKTSIIGANETFGWKNMILADITNDGLPEILVGAQLGDYELSKSAYSHLLAYNMNGDLLLRKNYKGWIKFIKVLWNERILLSAGKTLNFYGINKTNEKYELNELFLQKFDKPSISYDIKSENDQKIWIALGLIDGEIGFGLLEKNGNELSILS